MAGLTQVSGLSRPSLGTAGSLGEGAGLVCWAALPDLGPGIGLLGLLEPNPQASSLNDGPAPSHCDGGRSQVIDRPCSLRGNPRCVLRPAPGAPGAPWAAAASATLSSSSFCPCVPCTPSTSYKGAPCPGPAHLKLLHLVTSTKTFIFPNKPTVCRFWGMKRGQTSVPQPSEPGRSFLQTPALWHRAVRESETACLLVAVWGSAPPPGPRLAGRGTPSSPPAPARCLSLLGRKTWA